MFNALCKLYHKLFNCHLKILSFPWGLLFDNERMSEKDWLSRGLHENVFSPAVLNNFGLGRADNDW